MAFLTNLLYSTLKEIWGSLALDRTKTEVAFLLQPWHLYQFFSPLLWREYGVVWLWLELHLNIGEKKWSRSLSKNKSCGSGSIFWSNPNKFLRRVRIRIRNYELKTEQDYIKYFDFWIVFDYLTIVLMGGGLNVSTFLKN